MMIWKMIFPFLTGIWWSFGWVSFGDGRIVLPAARGILWDTFDVYPDVPEGTFFSKSWPCIIFVVVVAAAVVDVVVVVVVVAAVVVVVVAVAVVVVVVAVAVAVAVVVVVSVFVLCLFCVLLVFVVFQCR